MVGTILVNYLGFNHMNDDLRRISLIYLINKTVREFALFLLSTYLVLYLLDFISLSELGIIISTKFLVQLLLDYPSGALGDKIGQKNVLIISYLAHSVAVGFFVINQSFIMFFVGAIILGIGNSQESGALISWYDTTFNFLNQNETNLKDYYTQFMGSMVTFEYLATGLGILLGGLLASTFSRKFLLQFYLITVIFSFILIFLTLSSSKKNLSTSQTYISHIVQSFLYLTRNRSIITYYIGTAILMGAGYGFWFELMLFPYFYSYSGSDFLVGILRSSIFISSIGISVIGTKLATNIGNLKKYLVITNFLSYPIWFSIIYVFTAFIPSTGSFNFIGYIIIFLNGAWATIPISMTTILDRKLNSVIIPSEIRTSIYSVTPTFASIFSVIFSFIGGLILENQGFHFALSCIIIALLIGLIITSLGLKKIDFKVLSL